MNHTVIDLSRYHNALGRKNQLIRMAWTIVWGVLARPLPRSVGSSWKRFLLRLFGAKVDKTAIVYSSAKVYFPANLVMERYACLASDVARHGWASIAKSKNVPVSVISEAMGHESEKTTRIYLASLDASVIDRANSAIINSVNADDTDDF